MKPEKPPKDHVKRLYVRESGGHVAVRGHLMVDGHVVPLRYHLPADAKAKDHDRVIKEHKEKTKRWIERYPKFHALVGHGEKVGDADIQVTFAQIQMHGPYDWRLYASWIENGKKKSRTWHYRDPAHVMSTDGLLNAIRASVDTSPAAGGIEGHKEAVRVAARGEEKGSGMAGNGGKV